MRKRCIAVIITILMTIGSSMTSMALEWERDEQGWKLGEKNPYFTYYKSGWAEVDGKWYHFDSKTYYMDSNTVVDDYTLGPDGAWDGKEPDKTLMPDESDKNSLYVPKYIYTLPLSGPNTECITLENGYRFKREGEYLKNQWVRVYSKSDFTNETWISYAYVNEEGKTLKPGEVIDGFVIADMGFYTPPTYNSDTGKRGLVAGDTIKYSIEPIEERIDTNGNTYYLISSDTTTISFDNVDGIDENALILDFAAYRYNPETNTIYPFSNDGTAIYEDFQFGKVYDFKIENVDLTGAALVEYCKQNDILIRIDVSDRKNGIGISLLYCYE